MSRIGAWGIAAAISLASVGASAESEFKPFIPNAAESDCNTCHTDGGESPRNAFGLEVEALLLAAVPQADWWEQLRELDSDGDGQTNAQELGDPCLTWVTGMVPDRTTSISNPGLDGSLSTDPDACEDPPTGGGGGGAGEGGGGGSSSTGSGMGNGNGNGDGNGNGQGNGSRWDEPQWQIAEPQGGCQAGPGDDSQLGFWLLAIGALLIGRALRSDVVGDES